MRHLVTSDCKTIAGLWASPKTCCWKSPRGISGKQPIFSGFSVKGARRRSQKAEAYLNLNWVKSSDLKTYLAHTHFSTENSYFKLFPVSLKLHKFYDLLNDRHGADAFPELSIKLKEGSSYWSNSKLSCWPAQDKRAFLARLRLPTVLSSLRGGSSIK